MNISEVTPVVGYRDVLDIGIREMVANKMVGSIEPTDINAVVVFSLFLLLPCGERGNRVRLHKRVVTVVLARCVVVFIVA